MNAHLTLLGCGLGPDNLTPHHAAIAGEAGSVAGGHIGGGNRLARQIADAIGAEPVVTTATDAQQVHAFDDVSAQLGWRVEFPATIKHANSALLQNRPIGFAGPKALLQRYYRDRSSVMHVAPDQPLPSDLATIVAVDRPELDGGDVPILHRRRKQRLTDARSHARTRRSRRDCRPQLLLRTNPQPVPRKAVCQLGHASGNPALPKRHRRSGERPGRGRDFIGRRGHLRHGRPVV